MGERNQGIAMADRPPDDGPGNRPPPSDATRQLVVVAGAQRIGAFNGGQRSGLQRRGACVETRAGNATEGGHDRRPDAGYRRPEACRRTRPDDRLIS